MLIFERYTRKLTAMLSAIIDGQGAPLLPDEQGSRRYSLRGVLGLYPGEQANLFHQSHRLHKLLFRKRLKSMPWNNQIMKCIGFMLLVSCDLCIVSTLRLYEGVLVGCSLCIGQDTAAAYCSPSYLPDLLFYPVVVAVLRAALCHLHPERPRNNSHEDASKRSSHCCY